MAGTHFKGPLYSNGLEIPTLSSDGLSLVKSDGTLYALKQIFKSGAASSVTGTVSETTLATVTIPAGSMGTDGKLRIECMFSHTSSANNKILRIKFGGVTFGQVTNTTTGMWMGEVRVMNRSSAVQRGPGATAGIAVSGSGTTGAISGFTVDTATAQDVTFTGELANTGETITLEYYSIEVI